MVEGYSLPFELVDGYVNSVSITIPWTALLSDSCFVEISGFTLTLQPKQRVKSGKSHEFLLSEHTPCLQKFFKIENVLIPLVETGDGGMKKSQKCYTRGWSFWQFPSMGNLVPSLVTHPPPCNS